MATIEIDYKKAYDEAMRRYREELDDIFKPRVDRWDTATVVLFYMATISGIIAGLVGIVAVISMMVAK